MRGDPRTIGVLGGMSSESTVEYYRRIDESINDALGGHDAGDLVIRSVNFGDIERMIRDEAWDRAGDYLSAAAEDVEAAGAALVVMATNTMHKVAPRIEDSLSIPFVHIVDATAEAVLEAELDTVGVLGTSVTMEDPFYRECFERHGIDVLTPEPVEREAVDRIIFEELTKGEIREASRRTYLDVIDGLGEAGAQGIVFGCTEIELLIEQADRPELPMFDTTACHVDRAVELSLADEETFRREV